MWSCVEPHFIGWIGQVAALSTLKHVYTWEICLYVCLDSITGDHFRQVTDSDWWLLLYVPLARYQHVQLYTHMRINPTWLHAHTHACTHASTHTHTPHKLMLPTILLELSQKQSGTSLHWDTGESYGKITYDSKILEGVQQAATAQHVSVQTVLPKSTTVISNNIGQNERVVCVHVCVCVCVVYVLHVIIHLG